MYMYACIRIAYEIFLYTCSSIPIKLVAWDNRVLLDIPPMCEKPMVIFI